MNGTLPNPPTATERRAAEGPATPAHPPVVARLKQYVRAVCEASPLAYAYCTRGRPQHILRFDGGIGDEFLCSAVIRELRRRGARKIWMLTDHPELFRHNPDVALCVKKNRRGVNQFLRRARLATQVLSYAPHVDGRDIQPQRHVITAMCERLGLSGRVTKRPYLFLQPDEIAAGRIGNRQIAIQSSGLAAKYAARTKEWFPDRFQQVINQLRPTYTFVQIGSAKDPLLEGVVDLRGKTTIRQSAAILHESLAFVGLAGFLQHLARAAECRSVIIYGGRELPTQTGYTCNENLTNRPPCSPCWIYSACDHAFKCMDAITVGDVVSAVQVQLARHGQPLTEDTEVC